MPPHRPHLPPAPHPTKIFFDPFNSSSTGHQCDANRMSGSTSWRDSRTYKLAHQLKDASGRGGNSHLPDLVGAGSENFKKDGGKENRDCEVGAPELRENGWQDIRELIGGMRKRSNKGLGDKDVPKANVRRKTSDDDRPETRERPNHVTCSNDEERRSYDAEPADETTIQEIPGSDPPPQRPQIFRGLTIYLNGSTAPLVSDHRLKQLFAQHGGNASIALGRRTVSHVIIGDTCGGGLASGKINKENANVRGKSIKFITAQWVLDSVEKGVRQPEARYVPENLGKRIGGSGQRSVRGMFTKGN